MKLISWTGWTKEDWTMFIEKASEIAVWPFFVFFLMVCLAIG